MEACSFCNKDREESEILIKGAEGIYICNDCVAICYQVINDYLKKKIKECETKEYCMEQHIKEIL